MLKTAVICLLTYAVSADVCSVKNALLDMEHSLVTLRQGLLDWDGQLQTAIPLLENDMKLQDCIKAATDVAKKTEPLSVDDTLEIAPIAVNLTDESKATVDTLIDIKPKLDKIMVGSTITLENFKSIRGEVVDFGKALIPKIAAETRDVAKTLIQSVDDNLARGIKAFGG